MRPKYGRFDRLLGRLKFTVEQCINQYAQLSTEIFASPNKSLKAKYKFSSAILKEQIRPVAGGPTSLKDPIHDPPCKVFVVAV